MNESFTVAFSWYNICTALNYMVTDRININLYSNRDRSDANIGLVDENQCIYITGNQSQTI